MKPCSFPGCERDYLAKGFCRPHYVQRWRGSTPSALPPLGQTVQERFWSNVDKTGDCWVWTLSLNNQGYGLVTIGGKQSLSHRVSYAWDEGPIRDGLVIDHRCHNVACVRPSHLRAVTHKQNQEHRSGAAAGSASGLRGVSRHGNAWVARVQHGGVQHYGGRFGTPREAADAAKALRLKLFTHNDLDRRTS